MKSRRVARPALVGALCLVGMSAAYAQRTDAPADPLSRIERGQWVFKGDAGERKLCLTNTAALVQLMHGSAQCEHFVMEQTDRSATIRYTCPAHGHGRTTISVDSPHAVSVDTQGVADGSPFATQFEGQRVGNCG